ncbi:MAG TPA: type II toxin-antitoxin system VapB family antitoxin [Candidatus Eisenbacteria bacterium]|jgi:Arc/MetJ family transcription regulator|nr:type II toxin-antitoxin system VapB family antitoxin [Candidatus Eisenbacteria bacterium]
MLSSFAAIHMNGILLHITELSGGLMRTNIEIDDKLMKEAMRRAKTRTKRETVEEGLRILIRLNRQEGIRRFKGKVKWEGNLDRMRRS